MANENGYFKKLDAETFESIIPEPTTFYRVVQNNNTEALYLGGSRLDNENINLDDLKDLTYATAQQIQDIIDGNYDYDFNESTSTETLDPYDVEEATDRDIEVLLENYYRD